MLVCLLLCSILPVGTQIHFLAICICTCKLIVQPFCLTDLPSVVSGKQIGFFDPHQVHFNGGATGRQYSFHVAKDPKYVDQFSPYNVLDCDLSKSKYDGTLFRFPLRQKPSPNLCSTVCTPDRIRKLFRSFKADAHLVLLFLKSVEVISIYEWYSKMSQPRELFSVGLSGRTRLVTHQERKDLLKEVAEATGQDGKLPPRCTISRFYQGEITYRSHEVAPISQMWLVENYISTVNAEVHAMAGKLAQIPWVGLAVPIGQKTKHAADLGRIFCFLPLPPSDDADSNTGLPVHVHGSFSVADNRRSLKWPAADRDRDEKAVWNHLLAEQLLAQAYAKLIEYATCLSSDVIPVQDVYAMWPDMQHVQYQWSQYVIPLFLSSLAELPILYGEGASKSSWKLVQDVLISDKTQEHLALDESVAIEVLKRIGYSIAFPTANVTSCLNEIARKHEVSADKVSPGVVRDALKCKNYYQNMKRHNKIKLLKYVLQDRNYSDLDGLSLLPLADGTFTAFSSSHWAAKEVYIESVECPRSLFPGLNAMFLDETIDAGVCKTLRKAVVSGDTQLKSIQPTHVPSLISQVLSSPQVSSRTKIVPKPQTVHGQSTDSWIQDLWLWINRNVHCIALDNFRDMYIIPVTSSSGEKKLMKLTANLPAVYAQLPGVAIEISKELAKGLEAIGCTVLCRPPDFLTSCSQLHVCCSYICQPLGILTCISRAAISSSKYHDVLSQTQRCELAAVVSAAVQVCHPSTSNERNVLCQLPLFREWGGSSLVSISDCCQVAPVGLPETLPVRASLVSSPTVESQMILKWVPDRYYCKLSVDEVYTKFVFHQFQQYSAPEREKLVLFALDNIHLLESSTRQNMASLKFVPTGDGQTKAPNELFNPNERYVSKLIGDQFVFPRGLFAMGKKYGKLLLQFVGLRKLQDLTADELLQLVSRVASKRNHAIAQTLLKMLVAQPWAQQLLEKSVYWDGDLMLAKQALASMSWMPVIERCPRRYPVGMPWRGSSKTYLPACVAVVSDQFTLKKLQLIVGSQLAILDHEQPLSLELIQLLSCATPLNVYQSATRQLIEAHKQWTSQQVEEGNRRNYDRMLKKLFHTIGSGLHSEVSVAETIKNGLKFQSAPSDWIWLDGSRGFTRPQQLAVSSAFPVSLEPWLFTIEHYPHLAQCTELLQSHGMKANFEEEDVLSVLASMKAKYDADALSLGKMDRERDLELTLAVLNWVTRDQTILSESLQTTLLVPVDREDNMLELAPCSELMYCDADWLRRNDDTELDDYRLIHRQISLETAQKLGVPSLSNRMAPSEDLPFEQLGPHESLTLRLKNILKEYKDDVGIFEELLQNADDAGATEVKFLVDWREHGKSSLLAPGMSKCQGPALWAYNNSVFRDEDFTNIVRLAAGTKQSKLEKIGQFGLGFTSVYHITDVPSFVSRQFVVMFDPHKSHLGNHIRNPSQPGIKVNFVKRPIGKRFRDQFRPYTGVFGCQLEEGSEFEGTLFRFPLRTREQAAVSEIKNEPYDEDRVKGSLQTLKSICSKLLIFLHHVTSIQVFELESEASTPTEMEQIWSVQSKTNLVGDTVTHQELLLSSCRQVERRGRQELSGSVSVCKITWRGAETELDNKEDWLICSEAGKGPALDFSSRHHGKSRGLVPFAGVAVRMQENSLHPTRPVKGEAFCFLPLSERTGLPFHVNALFSMQSNRRGIWWHDIEETRVSGKSDIDAKWNEKLITDCLTQACMSTLKQLSTRAYYTEAKVASYYSLWPNCTQSCHPAWNTLATNFYATVVSSGESVFLTSTGNLLISLHDCVILLETVTKELPHAEQVMKSFCPHYVRLPKHVIDDLENSSGALLEEVTVDEVRFIVEWFAPHISQVNPNVRDELLLVILTRILATSHIPQSLRALHLIPCCPNGVSFRAPSDLIDPKCPEAELYLENEMKFPLQGVYRRDEVILALKKLGMRSTGSFAWDDLVERCKTVKELEKVNHQQAVQRADAIIELMNSLCGKQGPCPAQYRDVLKEVPFLLVAGRPDNYLVQWYADQYPDQRVVATDNVYASKCKFIVGSQAFILHESLQVPKDVASLLGLSSSPPLSMVMKQLDLAISTLHGSTRNASMIKALYKELQYRYSHKEKDAVLLALTNKAWIVVDDHVMKARQLAFDWGKRAVPYLSEVPSRYSNMKELFQASGVQQNFEPSDFVIALKQISAEANGKRLSKELLHYVTKLIIPEFSSLDAEQLKSFRDEVPLLSEDNRLFPASKLAYDDAPWMGRLVKRNHVFVHGMVARELAEGLGAKLVREKMLDRYARDMPGRPFGQSEPLTKRLKNILRQYPAGEEILKELLQNADDAGATELHISFDKRHYGTKRVFSEKWRSLQGPAICVYNNRPFTEADIEGIQNLGRGGKRSDPASTGQYGIGFNAVYHLTDCPSFLSDNKILCVLDPHYRYVPGADAEKPGRLFDVEKELWVEFSDVWECFKSVPGIRLDGGTLFRLPLRTAAMAKISQISDTHFDSKSVEKLLDLFKKSAPSMLLFLNNVTCIKLSVISETSKVVDSYEVKANLSCKAQEERLKVARLVAESKGEPTSNIVYNSAFYELDLCEKSSKSYRSDRHFKTDRWLVHQSVGIPDLDASHSIVEGSNMALLPRAGIAAPIKRHLNYGETSLFCFLPLPVKWNLPVQINGHFAVQSDRRGLWEDSGTSSRASAEHRWNEDLIKFVLAPSYGKFLLEARDFVLPSGDDENSHRDRLEQRLDWFHRLLPKFVGTEVSYSYLQLLLKELYGYILQHSCPLLAYTGRPCTNRFTKEEKVQISKLLPGEKACETEVTPTLRWLKVNQKTPLNLLTAYFWSCGLKPAEGFVLETLLLRLGFPVVSSPPFLFSSLKKANDKADVEYVSPQSVLLFLKQYRIEGSSCRLRLGNIEDTVFTSVGAADLVLQYVLPAITDESSTNSESTAQLESEASTSQLNGVPLLVTDNNQLMEFSALSPAFHSKYSDLLPKRRDLFVNKELYATLSNCKDPVLKKLSPADLVQYLPNQDVFPERWLVADQYYENWTPCLGPSKKWIETLWSFLKTKDIDKALECLKNLPIFVVGGGKMLVPPSLSYSVFWSRRSPSSAFKDIDHAVRKLGAVAVDENVLAARYGDYRVLDRVLDSLSKWFAIIEEPVSVVRALQYLYTERPPQTTSIRDAEIILKYFQNSVSSMTSLLVSGLKRLPLFETVKGTLTDLPPSRKCYTLPRDLCDAGAAVWMAETNCIFLKLKSSVDELYKRLELNSKTSDEVYVEYILPCFPKMSQDVRIVHLVRLMERCYRSLTDSESLTAAIKGTSCFNRQGVPRRICEFYDPRVHLFTLMVLGEETFPPTPPDSSVPPHYKKQCKLHWLSFLKNLGLKTACSKAEFLDFGKRMEKETLNWRPAGQEPADYERWKEMSEEMVNHLTTKIKDQWSDDTFMKSMSRIRFLPSYRVGRELEQLAVPFYKHGPATRYSTSYSEGVYYTEDSAQLCWTSQALLDQHGIVVKQQANFETAVGVQKRPGLDSVLTHLDLLVQEVKRVVVPNREIKQNTVDLDLLSNVLAVIYSYLTKHISDTSPLELSPFADLRNSTCLTEGLEGEELRIVEFLSDYPCVFLPDRQMFVKPQQVVFNLKKEIYPYLFQLPRSFVSHHRLLNRVGVDENPKPFHCARVLESLKQKYGAKAVRIPGDQKALKSVVRLLFKTLKRHAKPSTQTVLHGAKRRKVDFTEEEIEVALRPLYLPSRDEVLESSAELVYLDRPNLEGHVDGLQYSFLMNLTKKCGLSSLVEETVNLLPASLKPRALSELTEEVLDPECLQAPVDDQQELDAVAAGYQERYSSRTFVQGIRSIYIHEKRNNDFPDDLEAGLSILQNHFYVVCVPEIRTCLRLLDGGPLMKVDDVSKCCFLERSGSKATLYLEKTSAVDAKESGGGDIELYGFIARELQALLHSQLTEFAMMIIVSCPPNLIPTKLKSLNIPFDYDAEEPQFSAETFDYQPGMSLRPHHIPLLRQSPLGYRYNVDEWVAYEVGENCFVYAVILYQETLSDNGMDSELMTRYAIDVGKEEPKLVGVLSLYAFVRDGEKEPDEPERMSDGEKEADEPECTLAVSEVSQSAGGTDASTIVSGPETLEEKKEAVREQLRKTWQLPAEERRKAVKRLYLQWHPDKTDDPDAEEVFKFIMNEIKRLEGGGIDSANSYSSNYDRWNSFARSYGRRFQSRSSYSYQPPPNFDFSSQPQQSPNRSMGYMFVEQAEADLSVAKAVFEAGDSDNRRYAAVCFHCHEVVEKALKGLLFIHRGISDVHRRRHNIGYFLGAADFPGCPPRLKKNAERINAKNYYLNTRYPDQRRVVPATVYSRGEAEEALLAARAVAEDARAFAGYS